MIELPHDTTIDQVALWVYLTDPDSTCMTHDADHNPCEPESFFCTHCKANFYPDTARCHCDMKETS